MAAGERALAGAPDLSPASDCYQIGKRQLIGCRSSKWKLEMILVAEANTKPLAYTSD